MSESPEKHPGPPIVDDQNAMLSEARSSTSESETKHPGPPIVDDQNAM